MKKLLVFLCVVASQLIFAPDSPTGGEDRIAAGVAGLVLNPRAVAGVPAPQVVPGGTPVQMREVPVPGAPLGRRNIGRAFFADDDEVLGVNPTARRLVF